MSELWSLLSAGLTAAAALFLLPARADSTGLKGWALLRMGRLRTAGRSESVDDEADAAVLLDLTAALLSAGVGIEAALNRLAASVPGAEPLSKVHHALTAGAPWGQAADLVAGHPELVAYCEHLSFAYATGAPSASMLQAAAEQARAQRRQDSERRAEELGVKMMLPLGACFLPAFILVGVVPVVISMLPETLGF